MQLKLWKQFKLDFTQLSYLSYNTYNFSPELSLPSLKFFASSFPKWITYYPTTIIITTNGTLF